MKLDPVTFGVVWDRLIGTCNELVTALLNTSFSPVVREAGDLAAALFDPQGWMLCQPITGTPGHINPLSAGVKNLLREFPPGVLEPGDVLITNDPWLTTGQLLDVTVLVPVFREKRLIAHFACTCHMVDIGGYGPGAGAHDNFEEGILIPPMYLRRRGEPDRTLLKILLANNRNPEHFMGDLESMVGSCYVAGEKLLELLDEYGLENIEGVGQEILARSRAAQEAALRQIPEGTYYGETTFDGFDAPITLRCAVTLKDGTAWIDFAGSSPESPYGINVVLNYTAGYATFAIRSMTAPKVPNNDGSMAPIRVTAPEGCIVNARRPAPTTGRHMVGQFVADAVIDALRAVAGQNVVAEGAGAIWTVEIRGRREGRPYSLFITVSGGMGARPVKDGLSAVSFPANIAGVPVEVWETTIPVLVHRRALVPDSGGPGRLRGGLGQVVEFSMPEFERWLANLLTDRVRFPARGALGGLPGAGGRVSTLDDQPLPAKGRVHTGRADGIRLVTPGGGGWKPPWERDPEMVAEDVREGFVSREAALEVYGVALDAAGNVLWPETISRRTRYANMGKEVANDG